jgi:hypothetical protein
MPAAASTAAQLRELRAGRSPHSRRSGVFVRQPAHRGQLCLVLGRNPLSQTACGGCRQRFDGGRRPATAALGELHDWPASVPRILPAYGSRSMVKYALRLAGREGEGGEPPSGPRPAVGSAATAPVRARPMPRRRARADREWSVKSRSHLHPDSRDYNRSPRRQALLDHPLPHVLPARRRATAPSFELLMLVLTPEAAPINPR